jgi:hypothetical protein
MTTRRTRPGVTLVEVLIAIFVMALGLLALLTLFPLGALQMAQSIKDDRTSQTAVQADSYLRAYWKHSVMTNQDTPLVQSFSDPLYTSPPLPNPPWGSAGTPQFRDFIPQPGATVATTYPVVPSAPVPSYPVLIDPLGLFARTSADQFWTGWAPTTPGTTPLLPRRNLSMAVNQTTFRSAAVQTCCMVDDMTFQQNGQPGPNLDRQGRYTWAALVQRPRNDAPNVANLTVLVFDGRPPLLATPGDEVVVQVPAASFLPTSRSIPSIDVPNRSTDQLPLIRKGGWIMDGTIDPLTGVRNANFYRIAGVTENAQGATTTNYALDLDTPIKTGLVPPTGARIYLFAGLAEVFERPPLQPDSNLP